jgi:NADH-quinone oxidoreductase subunit E
MRSLTFSINYEMLPGDHPKRVPAVVPMAGMTKTRGIEAIAYRSRRSVAHMTRKHHPYHADIDDGMWSQIDAVIDKNRAIAGSVITVLRECQRIAGYLPVALLDYIGQGLNLPSSSVYGVASFYALFSMVPKGRHTIRMCLGTACYVKGIKEALSRIEKEYQLKEGGTTPDRRFSLEAVRCLGACGLAPVMVVDQDTHGDISSDKVIDLLEKYS